MRMNDYLSVCMFQLKVNLDCNSQDEYLIETEETLMQMESAFRIIEKFKPDISLFPEMTCQRLCIRCRTYGKENYLHFSKRIFKVQTEKS